MTAPHTDLYNAPMLARDPDKRIYSVSGLAGAARFTLEERFPLVWVEGEISNLRAPGSGHWYFTLKDDKAQLRCAMFANRNRTLRFRPRDGMQVILRGRVSLYEARGDFQLLADHLEAAGEGALRIAFEALKQKLADEGLFAAARKRALPTFPTHLAVVSSRTGAALRDIIAVLHRRCPTLRVTLLPVAVQGKDAEPQIIAALRRLADWPPELGPSPDVVLIARGGGSLEDLWSFNLETVARAIAACPIPVVSAIGHETDVTISDFVADLRAPTPSAGAELIAPDVRDWQRRVLRLARTLHAHWRQNLAHRSNSLRQVSRRLTHPGRALQQRMQRLDDLERQLLGGVRTRLARARNTVAILDAQFQQFHPRREVAHARTLLQRLDQALARAMRTRIERARSAAAALSRALHAVSPLETLGRGYAIVTTVPPASQRWGTPITSVTDTGVGAAVMAHLADGALQCTVREIKTNAE
jgi:exodeoxyribonuclease VII large subunit